jgi:TamB, inner membrane protein subunit of TAM complex
MRLFLKIIGIALGVVLVVIFSAWLYLFKLGGIEQILNDNILAAIDKRHHLELSVGRIEGGFISGVRLRDVHIYYVDSTVRYEMVAAPFISVGYAFGNIWEGNWTIDSVLFDSLRIEVRQDSTGRYLLPSFRAQGEPSADPASAEPPKFNFPFITIAHSEVRVVRLSDTIVCDSVSVECSAEGESGTFAVDIRRISFHTNREQFNRIGAQGKITYADKNFLFTEFLLTTGNTRIQSDGNINIATELAGIVNVDIDNLDLASAGSLFGAKLKGVIGANGVISFVGKHLDGALTLSGDFLMAHFDNLFVDFRFAEKALTLDTLYGSLFGDCTLDGKGIINFGESPETYALNADLRNFNLKALVPNALESDLTGSIRLKGESFRNTNLLLNIGVDLRESSLQGWPLQKASGDLIVTVDSITLVDPVRVDYYENVFFAEGTIEYSGEMNLHGRAVLDNLSRYKDKLFVKQPAGKGYAEFAFSGKTKDPNLSGNFISDSLWVYGLFTDSCAGTYDIKRFLTGRHGIAEFAAGRGSIYAMPFDSLSAVIRLDSTLAHCDTVHLFTPVGKLDSRAVVDYGIYPQSISADDIRLQIFDHTYANTAPFACLVDSAGFNIRALELGDDVSHLSASGRIDYSTRMDLALKLSDMPIRPWLKLIDTSQELDGILSSRMAVGGDFVSPRLSVSGTVDSLYLDEFYFGDLHVRLSYDNRNLVLDSAILTSEGGEYRAVGNLPLNLSFSSTHDDRLPEEPFHVDISAHDTKFEMVSLLMPTVEELTGDFTARFSLSGTARHPQLEGSASITHANLKYLDLEDPIRADSASVRMVGNRILIDNVEVFVERKPSKDSFRRYYAYLDGEITALAIDTLDFDVDVIIPREMPFRYELEDISGRMTGDLHVEGTYPRKITGDLTLLSCKYLTNFAEEDAGSPVMAALSQSTGWDIDINADILSNYWIKNQDIDAEFSGEVNFIRESGRYRFLGQMEILRGKGFLFDKTFRLEPGGTVSFTGTESLNPTLDITGYTRIPGSRDSANTQEDLQLGVHITGTLEKPVFNTIEGSGFAREDILPLIVANFYASDTAATSSGIERRVNDLISSQVSQIGSRTLGQIGVETFEIDPGTGQTFDPLQSRVGIGFFPIRKLPVYVYGRSALSGKSGREVGFEYRLNRSVLIEGLRDEKELYHMSLKLHLEF